MDEKRIQCLSNASQHVPSIFNRFPVIQPVSSKVLHFSTFVAHFGLPWVHPLDNRGKCYMDNRCSAVQATQWCKITIIKIRDKNFQNWRLKQNSEQVQHAWRNQQLTDRQTDRQTDKRWASQYVRNFVGGDIRIQCRLYKLPSEIKKSLSVHTFKNTLKQYLLDTY